MPRILTGIIVRIPCAHCGVPTPTHLRPDGSARCTVCNEERR